MRWLIVTAVISSSACGRIGFEVAADATSLDDGLVGYWSFDNVIGLTVADQSPSGNAGMFVGGAASGPGRVGDAVVLDGTGFVRIGDVAQLELGASGSVALWVREDTTLGDFDHAWWKGGSSTSYTGYDLELGANGWFGHVSDATTYIGIELGPTVLGRWAHVALVVDRSTDLLHGYIDGVEAATSPVSIAAVGNWSSMNPATIGARDNGAAGKEWFVGALDEVRIYNRALDRTEIAMLAQ